MHRIYQTTIKNNHIIHDLLGRIPFKNQLIFLCLPVEELMYGGMAGGGKSEALLLASLQYIDEQFIPEGENKQVYDALILRRTLDDLEMPNAILDRAKQWLLPYEETGLLTYRDIKKQFRFNTGATLTFRYLAHNNDVTKYQGSELQFVGYDELTQFTEYQYTYLHSRLRKTEDNPIPLRMRSASNPGGVGHEWVKARFVTNKSPCLFIPSRYTENPHLNQEKYGKQLDKITDEVTRQQLKYGNWDIIMQSGLLMDLETYKNRQIRFNEFKGWTPVYCTIGIDPASTGTDRFSMACICYFDNGKLVLVDLDSTTSSKPEQRLINFIIRNQRYKPRVVVFEKEAGSSPHYALNYWQGILKDLMVRLGFYVTQIPASSTGSKYNRALPVAYHIRNGTMYINQDINKLYEDTEIYDPVNELSSQLIYVHPDKEIMKQYRSPDELDSTAYAMEKMMESITGLRMAV